MDWKLIYYRDVQEWLLVVIAVVVLITDFIHKTLSEFDSIGWWIELETVGKVPKFKHLMKFNSVNRYARPY